MLQSRVFLYLAGQLNSSNGLRTQFRSTRVQGIMNPSSIGPIKVRMKNAKMELELIGSEEKHWFCGGDRSVARAAMLLQRGKIIAIPTDTIYGFAALASDTLAIERLYEIKKRDEKKPLAICLSSVNDVAEWGDTNELPHQLLETLLPGPYTIILRRMPNLNPDFNPGIDSVGIRVPNSKFVRSVAKIVGPLALTSANVSNKPSSLHPDEFSALWPKLDGIFYEMPHPKKMVETQRVGSTVVDLTRLGCYRIVRNGICANIIKGTLKKTGLRDTTASD